MLSVSKSIEAPIRLFHLSFRDFLVDPELHGGSDFGVDKPKTHGKLAERCILLLGADTLKEDVCGVREMGMRRGSIKRTRIAKALPEAVAYACCYWVQHSIASREVMIDNGVAHEFLRRHLIY